MKTLILLLALIPISSFAQVEKITVGGILIESFDQHLNWSQDFRLTANLNLKKTNHHLIFKKNTVQTSNAVEFSWGEPYLFFSYNIKENSYVIEAGIQKGMSTSFGSVVLFGGYTVLPKPGFSLGAAIHPQLIIFKKFK